MRDGLTANGTSECAEHAGAAWRPGPSLAIWMLSAFSLCLLLPSCAPIPTTVNESIPVASAGIDELLDRYTDSHRDGHSRMRILVDGPASDDAFVELIESATERIDVETLNFDDDRLFDRDIAMEFAQRFADKAKAGVRVRMILDPVVQFFVCPPEIKRTLTEAGVELRDYNPPLLGPLAKALHRTHKKILLADDRGAIIGGMNYGTLYFGENQWRDTNVLLTGPVVQTIRREFLGDWEQLSGQRPDSDPLPGDADEPGDLMIRALDQRPAQGDFDINNALFIAFRSAQHAIELETPYFNPAPWMIDELVVAADRGVEVRILTNSETSVDMKPVFPMMINLLGPLLASGAHVFLWGNEHTMHSKAFVIDDTFAMLGSYNCNYRSIAWDTENVVIFTDPLAVEQVRQMLETDLAHPEVFEIDAEFLDSVPVGERSFWQPVSFLF